MILFEEFSKSPESFVCVSRIDSLELPIEGDVGPNVRLDSFGIRIRNLFDPFRLNEPHGPVNVLVINRKLRPAAVEAEYSPNRSALAEAGKEF